MKFLEMILVFPISLFTIMNPMDDQAPATKGDIRDIRDDLNLFATKGDIQVIRDDLNIFATKEDLKNFATKDDLKSFATKNDLQTTNKDLSGLRLDFTELRRDMNSSVQSLERHIDAVLQVVVNIDKRLKETGSNHERRITRLEKAVF